MNTKKKRILEKLASYFISKGKVLSKVEYRKEKDTPIRPLYIQRYVGNWAKLEKMLAHNFPEVYEVLEEPKEPKELEELEEPKKLKGTKEPKKLKGTKDAKK